MQNLEKKHKKRKQRSSNEEEFVNLSKAYRVGGPSGEDKHNKSVSEVLNETNNILFDSCSSVFEDINSVNMDNCSHANHETTHGRKPVEKCLFPAESVSQSNPPSNMDIMNFLKYLEVKLDGVESRLIKLDSLEKNVMSFEKDLNLLRVQVHDQHKTLDNTLTSIAERCERVEFISAEYQSKVEELEKENSSLKDKVTYLESQSMRNNLVLSGFKEETEENLEVKFRDFLVQKLKIAKSIVDSIKLERIHRMGALSADTNRRGRNIVVKFAFFSDRELVRRQKHLLRGSDYYLYEQFPPEIAARRRKLVPRLHDAIKANKKAWLVYDTLYIEGKPFKCD